MKKKMLFWWIIHCRLNQCKLRANFCADLAKVLSSGACHLKTLDLSNNSLKDSGISLLTVGLRSPQCRLERLRSVHIEIMILTVVVPATLLQYRGLSSYCTGCNNSGQNQHDITQWPANMFTVSANVFRTCWAALMWPIPGTVHRK